MILAGFGGYKVLRGAKGRFETVSRLRWFLLGFVIFLADLHGFFRAV